VTDEQLAEKLNNLVLRDTVAAIPVNSVSIQLGLGTNEERRLVASLQEYSGMTRIVDLNACNSAHEIAQINHLVLSYARNLADPEDSAIVSEEYARKPRKVMMCLSQTSYTTLVSQGVTQVYAPIRSWENEVSLRWEFTHGRKYTVAVVCRNEFISELIHAKTFDRIIATQREARSVTEERRIAVYLVPSTS
jgi:hypothetical protein